MLWDRESTRLSATLPFEPIQFEASRSALCQQIGVENR